MLHGLAFLFPSYSAEASSVSVYMYCLLRPHHAPLWRTRPCPLHPLPTGRVASPSPSQAFPAPGWPSPTPGVSPPRAGAPAPTALGTSSASPQFADMVSSCDLTRAEQSGLIPPSISSSCPCSCHPWYCCPQCCQGTAWSPPLLLPAGPGTFLQSCSRPGRSSLDGRWGSACPGHGFARVPAELHRVPVALFLPLVQVPVGRSPALELPSGPHNFVSSANFMRVHFSTWRRFSDLLSHAWGIVL